MVEKKWLDQVKDYLDHASSLFTDSPVLSQQDIQKSSKKDRKKSTVKREELDQDTLDTLLVDICSNFKSSCEQLTNRRLVKACPTYTSKKYQKTTFNFEK